METKFLILSSNLLSQKTIDEMFSFDNDFDDINQKYKKTEQSFLIVSYNDKDDINTVIKKIDFKFKRCTLLCLDTNVKKCELYKHNLTTGLDEDENNFLSINEAKDLLLPIIEYMYHLLMNKELGYIKCIDKRDPILIEQLFENVCKN